MLTFAQAGILGLLQGITELFPISSLGHSVLVPALLHWHVDPSAQAFVLFLVATHFATACALLLYFWREWWEVIKGFFRMIGQLVSRGTIDSQDTYARLAWLLLIATIPAGILGLALQTKIEALFAAPTLVALVLVLNGVLLYGIELIKRSRLRLENLRNAGDVAISKLSWPQAGGAGLMQALSLIPGFSRTGSSLAGGLLAGLDRESAARFSFLLATPIIFAAATLKLPALFHAAFPITPILFGSAIAAVAAFCSVAFLLRYFKTNTLIPFAWYCIIAGALSFFLLTH